MMCNKYFFDTEANNDINIRIKAIEFAISLAKKDATISRIVLYLTSKNSTGWFRNIFDNSFIKKTIQGLSAQRTKSPYKDRDSNHIQKESWLFRCSYSLWNKD